MLSRYYVILTVTFGILSNLIKSSFGAYPIAKEYALVFDVKHQYLNDYLDNRSDDIVIYAYNNRIDYSITIRLYYI